MYVCAMMYIYEVLVTAFNHQCVCKLHVCMQLAVLSLIIVHLQLVSWFAIHVYLESAVILTCIAMRYIIHVPLCVLTLKRRVP